ncbi:phospholipase B-like 1 isoform X2 [Porites lutea]|uniref:phospholipase B-like 1 isoform X2 n=1 Tax=Porites lutea TaxID=51062 RepID=UPI003CC527C6
MVESKMMLFTLLCLLSTVRLSHSDPGYSMNGTVYYTEGKYHIEFGVLDKEKGVAYGIYVDNINSTGWGELDIVSGTGETSYSDTTIMYAAGYLEGALTAKRINENYVNIHYEFFSTSSESFMEKVKNWFDKQEEWMRSKIKSESNSSSMWKQMGNIVSQYDGLIAGYTDYPATEQALGKFAFQILNGAGDYITLQGVLNPNTLPDWSKMSDSEILTKLGRMGHCSALIKVRPGYEDIFAGHSSWFAYAAVMRIYKHYFFNLKDPSTGAKRMSFSSYAGYLVSLDDFYIMDSGLIMLQTTNSLFNTSLLKYVSTESLLAWHRVRLSNLMARGGKEWAEIYTQYNSGTYNNQYMLLDLKKVQLKKSLLTGALWVVEQIPGLVVSGDQTEILRAGYWPSYNVPFYEQVVDIESMKHILRYNDYPNDTYSDNNPYNSICSRGDLLIPSDRSPDGCYDTKVTDFSMAESLMSEAISGPTYQGLPVFCWSNYSFQNKHVGLPDCYDFDFVTMKPKF